MIQIFIGDEELDLGQASITLDLVSPFFADEIGYSSQSYSFVVPPTDRNNRLLIHSWSLIQTGQAARIEVSVWLFGSYWQPGELEVKRFARASGYRVSVAVDLTPLARKLSETNMRDFFYGGIRGVPRDSLLDDAAQENRDYVFFPLRNPGISPFFVNVNDYPWGVDAAPLAGEKYGSTIIPFPWLRYVLKAQVEESGFSLDESNFLADAEIRRLCLWNPSTLDSWQGQIDGSTSQTVQVNVLGRRIDLRNHLPKRKAAEMWAGLQNMFGLGIFFERNRVRLRSRQSVLDNVVTRDWSDKLIDYTFEPRFDPGYRIRQQLNDLDEYQGQRFREPDSYTLSAAVDNFSDLAGLTAAEGGLYYVRENNQVYQYRADEGSNPTTYSFQFYSHYLPRITVGAGREEVDVEMGSLFDGALPSTFGTNYGPSIYGPVNSPITDIGPGDQWPFVLMFFRGFRDVNTASGTQQSPYGGTTDELGTHNYSLLWHGERGLYEAWHRDWFEQIVLRGRPIKARMALDPADIQNPPWEAHIPVQIEEGRGEGLIRKIRLRVSRQGAAFPEVELVLRDFTPYVPPVIVEPPGFPPSPDFNLRYRGTSRLNIQFADASFDNGSPITAWSWDLGDGTTSTLQNPSHTYTAGTYTVTLTVTNANGSDSISKSITAG